MIPSAMAPISSANDFIVADNDRLCNICDSLKYEGRNALVICHLEGPVLRLRTFKRRPLRQSHGSWISVREVGLSIVFLESKNIPFRL